MTLEEIQNILMVHRKPHDKLVKEMKEAERYYESENDILNIAKKSAETNPMRNADNRIPSGFHGLLVDQKASYIFTAPPLFDVDGNKTLNNQIAELLGDEFSKVCKDLCVNASNCSVAWIHYWKNDGDFEYGVVDSKQIIPIWTPSLKKTLAAMLRLYTELDIDGKEYKILEYWDKKKCCAFRTSLKDSTWKHVESYQVFDRLTESGGVVEKVSELVHGFDEVPFIPFFNNNRQKNDLKKIKKYIDTYDKVYSGFINDLEDIQEIIFILSGYEGEKLDDFLNNLKLYKTVKVDGEEGEKAGLTTLTIDIPVEARKILLDDTRRNIFEQGQGIDPDPSNFGNSSGEALKYLYSLLELKAGLMETEFKLSFAQFVRVICKHLGKGDVKKIVQTWTRTSVKNDSELATIAGQSQGIISQKTIVQHHPWVEDPESELKQLEKEEAENLKKFDPYNNSFASHPDDLGAEDDEE